ncbi:MAG: deoxyribonuclease IV [Corynebacteriales bacterium]|nr:deoxyribonuclease IV [Mycobacteriales bacterium]
MRIGVHARQENPLSHAEETQADIAQVFLTDPQKWAKPKPHPNADEILASDVEIVVHAPYVANLASTNNRIRIPSRNIVRAISEAAAAINAIGVVVHGGHVTAQDEPAQGVDNWRKAFAEAEKKGGYPSQIFIENTAGGQNAMAKDLDQLARLWDAIGEYNPGFCLDTCHAWAAGLDLDTAVDKIKAITGRIDLVHLNNSRDEAGSGRDRHAGLLDGTIGVEQLYGVVRAAEAPVVLETPGSAEEHKREIELVRENC